jgi:transcriptional regulator with XRE-family HTH domain
MNGRNQSNRFGEWLRAQREKLALSEEEMAERLDVAIGTYLMWEVGKTSWASISADYKRKIEELLGPYPANEFAEPKYQEPYRPFSPTDIRETPTEFLEEIEEFAQQLRDQPKSDQSSEAREPRTPSPSMGPDALDFICNSCRSPVYLSENGQCQSCGRVGDNSQ